MCDIWNDTFLNLAGIYSREFYAADTEEYLSLLANSPIRVAILCEAYGVMVKKGMIEKIETITREEKLEIYNEAKRLWVWEGEIEPTEEYRKKVLTMISKAIYSLAQYIQT
jgi:hypothetical protein